MVHAGADITALLKLDASGFTKGLESTSSAVSKFKESMMELGKNSGSVEKGFRSLMKSLDPLLHKLAKFAGISKEVNTFKTFALALENIATAAQRMTTVISRGESGIVGLEAVISAFTTGVSSAEVSLRATNAQLQALARNSNLAKESTSTLKTSFDSVKADLDLMTRNFNMYGEGLHRVSDNEIRLKQQTQMMYQEFRVARSELMQFANGGVEAFNRIDATSNKLKAQIAMMEAEFKKAKSELMQFATTGVEAFNKIQTNVRQVASAINGTSSVINNQSGQFARLKAEIDQTSNSYRMLRINSEGENVTLEKSAMALQKNSAEMMKNAEAKLKAMGLNNQLTNAEQRETAVTNQNTSAHVRNSSAMTQSVGRTNQLTSATSRLKNALSSLRMIGTMVGSMLAYNFAHKLLVATGETIHAKSEMEGYFKMLNFGQNDINHFNQALDQTVAQFQRVNKYSLGETISSIGVEFNLTTKEMEKAMKVTSMITSEYLRAGRNANEASLAVKDVLQGQFQRLSRETGVKGEQLKEAGWSGDTTDVLGLMEALEKVGHSRNWDVFAEKANSLNDILTILQNRFGEWSADMVNVVQPTIVNVFNAILVSAQQMSFVISSAWEWLNNAGWEQTAVKIGALLTAILTVTQALTMYRTGMGMVGIAHMGLTKTIASVVLGLKGQEIAEVGVRNSILAKILGVNAEAIAESGVANAIREKNVMLDLESVRTRLNTLASEENSVAKMKNKIEDEIATALKEKKITVQEAETLQEELNTLSKDQNTIATLRQTASNEGMIASLYALGTGEALATAETSALSVAWGVLNGVFMLSPIGWITAGILTLAGAVFVLTGGLDEGWGKMQTFNETVEHGTESLKPYQDRVNQLGSQLEEAKEKYGENSEQVKDLQSKYDDAKDSLDKFNESLQYGTHMTQKLNDEQSQLVANLDAITRKNYGSFGHSTGEVDDVVKQMNAMGYGYDKTYVAYQKLVKMQENFDNAQQRAIPTLTGHGRGLLENAENLGKYNKAYQDYITLSTKANTSDNWWDWAWNSLYAGEAKQRAENILAIEGIETAIRDKWNSFVSGLKEGKYFKGDGDKIISEFIDGLGDSYNQWADGFGKWIKDGLDSAQETLRNAIDGFLSFDWLLSGVSASDGSSDHPSFMEDLSNIFGFNIQSWVDNFMADPMGTLGIDLSGLDIFGSLLNFLFGTGDNTDFSWATTYITDNIITPLSTAWNMFMSDPVSYLGGALMSVGGIGGLLSVLLPSDGGLGIWEWANTNLIQPLGNALYQGITSIPLVSDILALFGLVNGENSGSGQKGRDLGEAFKTAIEDKIRNIPIVGDILQMLGLIPQANGDAHSKGHGVGENIKQGEYEGHQGLADNVRTEMSNVITAISNKAGEAYSVAHDVGSQILNGIKNALDMHSPSIISRELINNEFGTYIPEAITSNGDLAYQSAMYYGQQIRDGISSVNTDSLSMDTAVGNYENDAQMIANSSQMMGTTTTTAFNDMSLAVNNTTSTMSSNVGSTYSQMQSKQSSSLQSMKTQNQTAYQEMYLKSHQSLVQMRDSTSNITQQMVSAWSHMKTQLVATANSLRSESTTHFNTLSNTIGDFYRKIQNPSNWGAGSGSGIGVRGARNPSVGRSIASSIRTRGATHHGAGGTASPYMTSSKTMSLRQLKNMICPSGNCDIFDGYDLNERVNVSDFLSQVGGEHGFGWSGWNSRHYKYIKDKSDQWDMKSPVIQLAGGIPTNTSFKVGDFENGTPQISFSSFQSMAEAIFTAIPYRFYYDSAWKGSWLGALQAGACNCSDGAEALIAFANACGFTGYKQHGTWRNSNGQTFGHFWAVINGHKMDTTGWQNQRTWTPSNSAGSPMVRRATHSSMNTNDRPINVTININEPVYGVDDLDSKIQDSVNKGLQREFNDPYTVTL